jgi:hypothetical protein
MVATTEILQWLAKLSAIVPPKLLGEVVQELTAIEPLATPLPGPGQVAAYLQRIGVVDPLAAPVDTIWEAILAARQPQPTPSAAALAKPAGDAAVQAKTTDFHINPVTLQILSTLLAQLAQWLLGKLQPTNPAIAA